MPVKPTESEEAYFARLEMERRTPALAAQESRTAEGERQRILAVARHHCPKCGAPLVTLHHRGVESEQCSHCQGIWLDRGELEQVLAGAPAQGFFGSLKRLWESGEGKRPCQAVTSGHVFSCAPDDDIHAALKTMRHAQVRRLPVVNVEGLLQGMLCLNDIVLRAEEARGKHVPAISYDEAMRTLKAICEHRATTGVAPA